MMLDYVQDLRDGAVDAPSAWKAVITPRRRLPAGSENRPPPTSRSGRAVPWSAMCSRFRPQRHRTDAVLETQSLRWRRGDDVVLPGVGERPSLRRRTATNHHGPTRPDVEDVALDAPAENAADARVK